MSSCPYAKTRSKLVDLKPFFFFLFFLILNLTECLKINKTLYKPIFISMKFDKKKFIGCAGRDLLKSLLAPLNLKCLTSEVL